MMDQQQRDQLLTIVDRGTIEQLFAFLQGFHRRPFQNLNDVMEYTGVIDDQMDFIDCTGTKYNVTPLIIAAGKGSYEKAKILLVHGANPNKQCATGDTALNLAVHRQKYLIVDLLLHYNANPNLSNRAGKTALHRAVLSYTDEHAKDIRALLEAGADLDLEDRNRRIPLDEAVLANRPEIVDILLSHDRTLVDRAYRAAIIASRLGHDKCLEVLLNYGMNPNITDRTNTIPLHVAIRSLKLSTVRLLVASGANYTIANNRGETAIAIAQSLQPDLQENFLNALVHAPPPTVLPDFHSYKAGNVLSYVHPLLRNHSNWTLDNDEFRSSTAENSSVQNLLDISNETYWCCPQSKNAWVIFDLKHQYNLTGVRIVGCNDQSTPKDGHIDVSSALHGPWLTVKDFTCLITQGNKNDFLFPSSKTRFIRVFISNNYGGEEIRIQGIGFFGVDMDLVNLLKEYGLENSLNTLLANGINDPKTLEENQDEILNSSDKYLHVNDHFQFIRLTESLRIPQLTFLEWFGRPQTTVIAGEKLRTFSVAADEGLTDRVQLEEKLENSPQATAILLRDLEPIQGHSLVDFPDYTIKHPGRYKIRVVSVDSPDIHTDWQEIVVGPTSSHAHKLNTEGDEQLYLSSTSRFVNDTTGDKENTLRSKKSSSTTTTTLFHEGNRAFVVKVYDSEPDETEDDTYLVSLKTIEDSPYHFPLTNMSYTTDSTFVNYRPDQQYRPEHYTQTKAADYFDHSTNTDDDYDEGYNSSSVLNSKSNPEIYLTPSKYRSVSRTPLSNIFPSSSTTNSQKQWDDDDMVNYGDKIIIPTKYRLQHERINRLLNDENTNRLQQQPQISMEQQHQSPYEQREETRKRTQSVEKTSSQKQQSQYRSRHQSQQQSETPKESSPEPAQPPRKRTDSGDEPSQSHSEYYGQGSQQNGNKSVPNSSPSQKQSHYEPKEQPKQRNGSAKQSSASVKQQSQYEERDRIQQQSRSVRELSSPSQEQSNYYELELSPEHQEPVRESSARRPSRKRTDLDDESPQYQSQYYGQGPLQKQTSRAQNLSPSSSPKQNPNYEPRERSGQRTGSTRAKSSPQQQQQQQVSDDYEQIQTPERIQSARESPVRQHQSPHYHHQRSYQRNASESPSPPRIRQLSQKRHGSERDPTQLSPNNYDQPSEPRTNLNDESPIRQFQISTENFDQDNVKSLYNRYQIIAGDLELRESSSDDNLHPDQSKSGQMQLIFRATVQGLKVQERANNSIQNLVANYSRIQSTSGQRNQGNFNRTSVPSSRQSSIRDDDRPNQNLPNATSDYERSQRSRFDSASHAAQSTSDRHAHDKQITRDDDVYLQPSSAPGTLGNRQSPTNPLSSSDANRRSGDHTDFDNHPEPPNIKTQIETDDDLDGIHERSRSSSRNPTPSKQERTPVKPTSRSHSSPSSTSPKVSPRSAEPQTKYFFGEHAENPPSDDDSDEADCEMFGHNSQPKPIESTTTRRSLEYPSTTNPRFPTHNNYPFGTLEMRIESDTGTSTEDISKQQQQQSSSGPIQSTVAKSGDSAQQSRTPPASTYAPPRVDYEAPDTYPTTSNYIGLNQHPSNQTSSTSAFPQQYQTNSSRDEQNTASHIRQEQSPSRSDQDRDDDKQSLDDDSDDPQEEEDDNDLHDQIPSRPRDHNYTNDRDNQTDQSEPHSSGVDHLIRQNPVRDVPPSFQPMQYPTMSPSTTSQTSAKSPAQKSEKKGIFSLFRSNKDKPKEKNKPTSTSKKTKR